MSVLAVPFYVLFPSFWEDKFWLYHHENPSPAISPWVLIFLLVDFRVIWWRRACDGTWFRRWSSLPYRRRLNWGSCCWRLCTEWPEWWPWLLSALPRRPCRSIIRSLPIETSRGLLLRVVFIVCFRGEGLSLLLSWRLPKWFRTGYFRRGFIVILLGVLQSYRIWAVCSWARRAGPSFALSTGRGAKAHFFMVFLVENGAILCWVVVRTCFSWNWNRKVFVQMFETDLGLMQTLFELNGQHKIATSLWRTLQCDRCCVKSFTL